MKTIQYGEWTMNQYSTLQKNPQLFEKRDRLTS